MDDKTTTAKTDECRKNRTSLTIVALTAGLGATLFMSGLAHAEPMISAAQTFSEGGLLKELGFADERLLFGTLTFGFSLMAAGVWHRSFRGATKPKRPSGH